MPTDSPQTASRADDLLAGPRGRRVLLEFLTGVEQPTGPDGGFPVSRAVHTVADALDPQRDRRARYVRFVHDDAAGDDGDDSDGSGDTSAAPETSETPGTPEAVARLIGEVLAAGPPLPDPTAESLDSALDLSVSAAMYWQEPDGYDALAAHPAVREALRPVAEHLAASPVTDWWWSTPDLTDQWSVSWGRSDTDADPVPDIPPEKRAANLRDWSAETRTTEQRHDTGPERRRAPEDVPGGNWWSLPLWCVPTSSRRWPGTTGPTDPVQALFIEDRWEDDFSAGRFTPPTGSRIREITGADDWAALCREFPLEVTWSYRGVWYEVTGRDSREAGPWLVPDWSQVAQEWDAVHLTVAGYLAAATRCIPVPGAAGAAGSTGRVEAASVIGGWGPDVTYWLV
ncbi:MAG TPA: hypothetical protein DIW82_02420 [Corynebacterium nuruki]|uniref:Uncharacterized protein n=1 Tax=Corynebacterium nuruki TaxID=1032851 RepID=A0A3D4SXB2_9CORY|nr:hypothetical protein [Corynebacterium nuruki]